MNGAQKIDILSTYCSIREPVQLKIRVSHLLIKSNNIEREHVIQSEAYNDDENKHEYTITQSFYWINFWNLKARALELI